MMIQPIFKKYTCLVHVVTTKGKLIYPDKIDGHFIGGVDPKKCGPRSDCWMHDDDNNKEIILPKGKNKGTCKPSPSPYRRSDPNNGPWVGRNP